MKDDFIFYNEIRNTNDANQDLAKHSKSSASFIQNHSYKKRKDSLETRGEPAGFSL